VILHDWGEQAAKTVGKRNRRYTASGYSRPVLKYRSALSGSTASIIYNGGINEKMMVKVNTSLMHP
jgi:hypothetical protein